ncbi:heavy-metal-associated domain-containing protein [Sabulilitoribacter multivorans]|uniref:Heavy-metal-associated domain-containing protein n=1 Tax=Flaviramulus multivorans TaxID=1304750 RepID=A0ABS9IER6_9FLAO|nr:heavy-metal-associated domain-containing protein [Flaviramulus multivorans]MCF7559026.1 heavy-metal-associated domain-containing protein [Flaviramulus multivorans]
MKILKLQIPNMQSAHCQMRVNKALHTIPGATSINTKSGEAYISMPNEMPAAEAIIAVEKAGYYVSDIYESMMNTANGTEPYTELAHC